MFLKMKKWLERLAAQNERRYGGQKLDCCGMNRQHINHARPAKLTPVQDKTDSHC